MNCGAVFKGQEAKIEDFPYQVSIQNSDGNNHFCGGVIIDRRHVLTAAHCLYGFEPEDFKVVAGVSNLKLPGSVYSVSDLFVHDGFAFNRPAINDIALLRVNTSFQFSDVVKPAKLSMARRAYGPSRSSVLYISGYGRDSLHSWSSKLLRKGELRITHVRLCEKYFKKHNYYQPQNQICTKEKITGRGGICKGDSGGPLSINGRVIGIASFAMEGCAGPGDPSVFTKISSYVGWIQRKIKMSSMNSIDMPD
ncbi:chymotrypsin-1-like [Trichogramma pretiosum]|uniref:chymotrypsin-1-like n=1 Tax=Trichogramma pretiosum TaxID=7493 RepID=UPI000C7189BE|nr:chymotrypsin-1-like [Trichogramma pretiosum]